MTAVGALIHIVRPQRGWLGGHAAAAGVCWSFGQLAMRYVCVCYGSMWDWSPSAGCSGGAQGQPRPLANCGAHERGAVWEGLPSCVGRLGEANTQDSVGAELVVLPQWMENIRNGAHRPAR